ncbi:hypothetical protein K7X08_026652 [Anisodus acutangulus]|uniref:Uncharacterized protein n=1 Tax=Anisodus acutangulus TaxID=402998 RepID=A0A9Q1L822_9SOLA|nr:hypothetical protein K7X08_026652 [Anisodus acutangulus]
MLKMARLDGNNKAMLSTNVSMEEILSNSTYEMVIVRGTACSSTLRKQKNKRELMNLKEIPVGLFLSLSYMLIQLVLVPFGSQSQVQISVGIRMKQYIQENTYKHNKGNHQRQEKDEHNWEKGYTHRDPIQIGLRNTYFYSQQSALLWGISEWEIAISSMDTTAMQTTDRKQTKQHTQQQLPASTTTATLPFTKQEKDRVKAKNLINGTPESRGRTQQRRCNNHQPQQDSILHEQKCIISYSCIQGLISW